MTPEQSNLMLLLTDVPAWCIMSTLAASLLGSLGFFMGWRRKNGATEVYACVFFVFLTIAFAESISLYSRWLVVCKCTNNFDVFFDHIFPVRHVLLAIPLWTMVYIMVSRSHKYPLHLQFYYGVRKLFGDKTNYFD